MASEGIKHVYILGAGFSVPLGGPLFKDLFSRSQLRVHDHIFDQTGSLMMTDPSITEKWEYVRYFPLKLDKALKSKIPNEGYPDALPLEVDAERVLEWAEALVHDNENWLTKRLLREASTSLRTYSRSPFNLAFEIYKLIKMRLVIETNAFLSYVHNDSERWKPYLEWFGKLNNHSTIITTNYDLLLETLFKRTFSTLAPRRSVKGDMLAGHPESPNGPLILKLHGSCNWYKEGEEKLMLDNVSPETLVDKDILIGTPGISKQNLAKSDLKEYWDLAKEKLNEAEVISIVGYSLPETDNVLRMVLLDRIAESSNIQAVNIVLGSRDERGYRAEEIIKQAMPDKELRDRVTLLPMYAQDYLPTAPDKAYELVRKGDVFMK